MVLRRLPSPSDQIFDVDQVLPAKRDMPGWLRNNAGRLSRFKAFCRSQMRRLHACKELYTIQASQLGGLGVFAAEADLPAAALKTLGQTGKFWPLPPHAMLSKEDRDAWYSTGFVIKHSKMGDGIVYGDIALINHDTLSKLVYRRDGANWKSIGLNDTTRGACVGLGQEVFVSYSDDLHF